MNRSAITVLPVLLLGLVLAGCKIDQSKEVDTYRQVLGAAEPTHSHGEPLSLHQAAALTNAYNEQLSTQGERYLQALIDRKRRTAALLPTVDLVGTFTFRDRSSSAGSGSTTAGTRLFDAGPRLQYDFMTGLTDVNRVQAAELGAEQQRWLLLDLRESLLLETARAYYAVLVAERQIGVIESSLKVQDERLRDIRGRSSVGFARPLDVSQIEAQAARTRVQLLNARNQAANARTALSLLIGSDASVIALTDGLSAPTDSPARDELHTLAWQHRQDLAAARAIAAGVRAEVDAEIGRYYPTVSLNFDYFLTRDSVPTDRDWSGLLSVNLPIFAAGRIQADVRDAWSRFRQAVLDHSLSRRQVRRDVDIAYSDLESSRARLVEIEAQLSAAREALRQAEAAYSVGLGTNLERVAAQDQVLSAELLQAQEIFTSKIAYLAMMRAIGRLSPALLEPGPEGWPALPPDRPIPDSPFITLPPPSDSAYR